MKHYDDLQRFKDKTRTGAINFKDMSAQTQAADGDRWAIIKQLNQNPDAENALSHAGSVSVPAPQSVKADEFDIRQAKPAPAISSAATGQSAILASVASVVAPLQTRQAPLPDVPAAASTPTPPPATSTLFEQLSPALATKPQAVPAPPPRQQTGAVPFNKLFAAKTAPAATHAGKDLPLQPLLEMIASCH